MKQNNRIRLTESQLHRVIRESVMKVLNERFYPNEGEDITHDGDYSYGAIMTVKCEIPGALDEDTAARIASISEEYIEDEYKYTNVMVNSVNVDNDTEFNFCNIEMNVAVSSADMPLDAICDEIEEMVWIWIERQTKRRMVKNPEIEIGKVVFDRREYYKD